MGDCIESYLEVDDDKDDDDGGDEVRKVWCILSVEGILESINFVALGQQEVEQSNNRTFKFSSLVGSDGDG